MKYLATLLTTATVASALSVAQPHPHGSGQDVINPGVAGSDAFVMCKIETSEGEVKWVHENEKWEMRRNGIQFFDITFTESDSEILMLRETSKKSITYPSKPQHNSTVKALAKDLKQKNMRKHLEKFTAFHTRYYKSDYGIQSATWLYEQVSDTIKSAGADKYNVTVEKFDHPWGQFSIIARIPGKSQKTVVVAAHQDSINLFLPSIFAAPGADDDGSGTVTILEAFRVLLTSDDVVQGNASNTVEFHWYSAEEGGLLGSQAIFAHYSKNNREVVAMLQQDMTGYIHKTIEAGEPESVGVITDYVDPGLTTFIKTVVEEYCDIPYIETKCGYACSDHASASKYGYPSAFVIESDFKYSDQKIHTTADTIDLLSFDHMLQHSKMTLGYAYELAMADL